MFTPPKAQTQTALYSTNGNGNGNGNDNDNDNDNNNNWMSNNLPIWSLEEFYIIKN